MNDEKEREIALYYLRNIADKPLAVKMPKYDLMNFIDWIRNNFQYFFNDSPMLDSEYELMAMRAFMEDVRKRLSELDVSDIAQEGFDEHLDNLFRKMETHPLPFVCTTNLMDDLDQAALRRFTFKVRYDYLRTKQMALAFRHFFNMDAPSALANLNGLTPGDFAVVKNKAAILDATNPDELVNMLEMEQSAKGIKSGNMGFTASGRRNSDL